MEGTEEGSASADVLLNAFSGVHCMKKITQIELLRQFLEENLEEGNAGNGHVKNNQYIHFRTPILERYGDKYILNQTRYSLVTGRIQKRIQEAIPLEKIIFVRRVPENYKGSLSDFIENG